MLRLTAASRASSSAVLASMRVRTWRSMRSPRSCSLSSRRSLGISLGLPRHLFEQGFDLLKALVALNRELQRLWFEGRVAGVEESDDRAGLAEMSPRRCKDLGLPA